MAFSWSADTLVDFSAISANASFLLAADALTYLSISLQVRRSSQRISASNALYQSHFALEAVAQSTLSVTSDLCAWRRSSFKYCILWTSLLSSGVHILLRRLGRQLINELYDQFELKECDDYHFYRIADQYFKEGILTLKIIYLDKNEFESTVEVPFSILKKDILIELARYIQEKVIEPRRGGYYN